MSTPFIIRTLTYISLFFTMLSLERVSPFAQSGQRKSFRVIFHLSLSFINSSILYLLLAAPTIGAVLFAENHDFGIARLIGLKGMTEIVAAVIVFDLWDYWMHLVNHRISFLWRFHRAHHSDMEVDVTTASRFHIGELIISNGVKCLMILLWGPSLWGLAAFEILLTAASQFHHGNVRMPPIVQDSLEKGIVTPRMHRCHHALSPNCFNSNFSTIFSVWDRLFRTYHWAEDAQEMKPIGVSDIRGPETMKIIPLLMSPLKGA